MQDPLTYFDRISVITLRSTPQRLAAFQEQIAKCDWPFREVAVVHAIDGLSCPPPPWWRCGPQAWGARQSHLRIIEDALNDGVQRILILEDDAEFVDNFRDKALAFIDKLPGNAELVFFGGQTSHKHQRPQKINDLVIMPESVNRLHCYSLTRSGMVKVYRHINRLNWQLGRPVQENGGVRWKGAHHVDHHLEILQTARQIVTYAPTQWLVNQGASFSTIMGRHQPERDFTGWPKPAPFIAVLGPWRSGTSAVAGAMHYLGVNMGAKFLPVNRQAAPKGCFEAVGLRNVCQSCYPEPSFVESVKYAGRVHVLREWLKLRKDAGAYLGGKNPLMCLMVPECCEAWPECKFIVVHRDIDHATDSLRRLGWFQPYTQPDTLTRRLIETRDRDLQRVPQERQLHINYDDMLHNSEACLTIMANFAGIQPTPDQYARATAFLDSGLNHHNGQVHDAAETRKAECDCAEPCPVCRCGR